MFVAGLLFGMAVVPRPIFGPLGLVFFFFILFAGKLSRKSLLRSISFSIAFGIVLFLVVVENHYISKGQIKGLSANQSFNLFTQFCKPRNSFSTYHEYHRTAVFASPVFLERPEYGFFYTDRAFHDNEFFLKKAKDCIRENPHVWLDNLKLVAAYFNGPLFPTFQGVRGFSFWMPVFSALTLFLSLSVGLGNHWQRQTRRKVFGVEKINTVPLERAGRRKPDGMPGNRMGLFIMPTPEHAVLLELKNPRTAHLIEVSTDSGDSYRLQFYLDKKHMGDLTLPAVSPPGGGIRKRILGMPRSLRGQTFNRILVRPLQGDGTYSLAVSHSRPGTP